MPSMKLYVQGIKNAEEEMPVRYHEFQTPWSNTGLPLMSK
jgi:hypothetical protein